jgi:hypothetical protein
VSQPAKTETHEGTPLPLRAAPPDADLEYAAVLARRESLARARAEREAMEAPQRKLAAEKLALANEEAIELAEQREGPNGVKIAVVRADGLGVIIVRRAHPAAFRRYMDRGEFKTKYLDELVRTCLVHPTLAEYEAIIEQQPALLVTITDAIGGLAGVRAETVGGKQ